MQAPELEPRGAAEWIGTVVGFVLTIPFVLGVIALLSLTFALPFALIGDLFGEPLWLGALAGMLAFLGCAVALWAIDAVVTFSDVQDRTDPAGQQQGSRGPLQRVLGLMVDHATVVYWSAAILALSGCALAFGIGSSATITGMVLLWCLLWWLPAWIWRRIRPTDQVKEDRMAHIRALQAQRDSAAVCLLGRYLHDPKGPISRRAAFALADIGSPEATEELRRAVTDAATQPVTRWARFALWLVALTARRNGGKSSRRSRFASSWFGHASAPDLGGPDSELRDL